MSQSGIQLTGWKAVAVLVVVLGFGAFRYVTARQSLQGQGREALEEWVRLEVQREILAEEGEPGVEMATALVEAEEIRIQELSGRGSLDDMVVRVLLEPHPALPGEPGLTRYYRMSWSRTAGWRHRGDASALAYHLALF